MKKYGLIFSIVLMLISISIPMDAVFATQEAVGNVYSEPKIVVTSYEVIDGIIASGEEFTIRVQLNNMNKYSPAYNVVTSLSSANNNLVIVDEKSNQVYFEVIEAGAAIEFTMKLKLLDMGNSELTVLSFVSTYYNAFGYKYDIESKLTLIAEEQAQLEIPAITISENAVVGANALVSVRYSNTGDSKLYNVKMRIEGNIDESQKKVDLGNLNANDQMYKDSYVTFTEAGTQKLKISFEYQDKVGNTQKVGTYEYSLNVYSEDLTEETEYVVDMGKIKLGMKEVYMLAIGAVLVLILVFVGLIELCKLCIIKSRK